MAFGDRWMRIANLPLAAVCIIIWCMASVPAQEVPPPPPSTTQIIDALLKKIRTCNDTKEEFAAVKQSGLTASDEVLTDLIQRLRIITDFNTEGDIWRVLIPLGPAAETRLCTELQNTDDPFVKRKLLWAVTHFYSAAALHANLDQLKDPRDAQIKTALLEGSLMRLCDYAINHILVILSHHDREGPVSNFGTSTSIVERDQQIAKFKTWWKEKGSEILQSLNPSPP